MRAKIQRRAMRNRAPPKPQEAELPIPTVDHVGNGLAEPSVPPIPPELVQAIVRLNERVGALEQTPRVELIGLELKARCKALELALEVIDANGPIAPEGITEVAEHFLTWLRKPN